MFLRVIKPNRYKECFAEQLTKAVFMGDNLVMEYGDEIVGIARLHEESENCLDYDIIAAKQCELGTERIVRTIKTMIVKSDKFAVKPNAKRRKYYIEEVDCKVLPVKAKITVSRL